MSSKHLRERVLLACAAASFLTPFSSSSVAVILPRISAHYGVSLALSNWSVSSYLMALAASILPFGGIADWKGRGKVFLTGLMIMALSSISVAFAPDFPSFIAVRAIQGVGSAMISATSVAVISQLFGREERGKAIGINTASVYIGLSLGPLLGGMISDLYSWIGIFVLSSLISLLAFAVAFPLLGLRSDGSAPKTINSVLYALSMISLTFGISKSTSFEGLLSSALASLTLAFWLLIEFKSWGLVGPELLRRRAYSSSTLAALLNYSSTYAISIILSNYLQKLRGFSASQTGILLTIQPVTQALLSPLAGHLADKRSPPLIASAGMILIALGIATLYPLTPSKHLIELITSLIVLGVGFALFASPNTLAALNASPPELYGSANSFLGSTRFLGQSISAAIMTSLMTSLDLQEAMNYALLIYAAISSLGALISITARFEEIPASGGRRLRGSSL